MLLFVFDLNKTTTTIPPRSRHLIFAKATNVTTIDGGVFFFFLIPSYIYTHTYLSTRDNRVILVLVTTIDVFDDDDDSFFRNSFEIYI